MRARTVAAAILGVFASALIVAPVGAWSAAALWFRLPLPEWARAAVCCLVALGALATIIALLTRARWRALLLFALAFAGVILWWGTITPPADGDWAPDVARQTTGTLDGDILTLSDVRDFDWRSDADFTERWNERSYDLSKLKTLDLFLSYWAGPQMAHLIMSFGFDDGRQLAWSIEVQAGEERPVFARRGRLQIPHGRLSRDDRARRGARALERARRGRAPLPFARVAGGGAHAAARICRRGERAKEKPAFYNSITTNCTTAVAKLIRAAGGTLPLDWRLIVNGYLPGYLYDRRAVVTSIPLSELMALARIDDRARAADRSPDFSELIRVGVPSPHDPIAR